MINTQDLRIGNIVLVNSKTPGKVTRIYEDRAQVEYTAISDTTGQPYVKRSYIDSQWLEGIPLTPECMERLGFTVEYTVGGWLRWQKGDFKLLDRKLPHTVMEPALFVHQLMNIYHAITGRELEVKLCT